MASAAPPRPTRARATFSTTNTASCS
jgi:hypothetical protein